jgi:hypothetical protein
MPDLRLVKDDEEELPEREPIPNWAQGPPTPPPVFKNGVSLGPGAWVAIVIIGLIGGFISMSIAMAFVVAILLGAIVWGVVAAVRR